MQKNNHKFKLSLLSALIFLFSCAPSKTDQQVKIHVYCDDCDIRIVNKTGTGNDKFSEVIYDGNVTGQLFLTAYRWDSDINCIQASYPNGAPTNIVEYIVIENTDTLFHGIGNDGSELDYGYCH